MGYYSLFRRPNKKGEIIYYYRVRNPDGTRSVGHSTHQKTKLRANDYCQKLILEGLLWEGDESTFKAYAEARHWFEWDKCEFVKDRLTNSSKDKPGITESTVKRYEMDLRLYLVPFFGKMKLKKIMPENIRQCRTWMQKELRLSNKTINNAMGTMRILTDWALNNHAIYLDPFRGVKALKLDSRSRDALTLCEARRILKTKWKNRLIWLYNLTAAVTGLRMAEI